MKYSNNLHQYPIFKHLNKEDIEKFEEKIKLINFNSKEIIIKEGDEGNSILFLFDGDINISQALTLMTSKSKKDNREKELIKLNSTDHHISFGELSLFKSFLLAI